MDDFNHAQNVHVALACWNDVASTVLTVGRPRHKYSAFTPVIGSLDFGLRLREQKFKPFQSKSLYITLFPDWGQGEVPLGDQGNDFPSRVGRPCS